MFVFVTSCAILAVIWALLKPLWQVTYAQYSANAVRNAWLYFFVVITFWLLFVIVARLATMKRFRRYAKRGQKDCYHALAHRWICLFDRNDEAILGLNSVRRFRLKLFAKRFAVPAFSLVSLFVIPLLISIAAVSPSIMTQVRSLADPLYPAILTSQPSGDLASNIEYLFFAADLIINTPVLLAALQLNAFPFLQEHAVATSLLLSFAMLLSVCVLSFLVTLVVYAVSIGISSLLSRVLDLLTWNAIRRLVFGSDTAGEAAVDAFAYPVWMQSGNNPIPQPLSDELIGFANQEAIKLLPMLRQTVYELAFSIGAGKPANFIQNYLSWNEIIHTSYFNIPHFRMLVGFVISKGNGFYATQAFKDNREFEVVAQWFDEIEGK